MSTPELAASIQRVDLLQNLIVVAAADGQRYEVVAGGQWPQAGRAEAAGEEAPHQQGGAASRAGPGSAP
jgi:ParB-like chromosome segregation protein Spo0J